MSSPRPIAKTGQSNDQGPGVGVLLVGVAGAVVLAYFIAYAPARPQRRTPFSARW